MKKQIRYLVMFLFLVSICFYIYHSICILLADIYHYPVKNIVITHKKNTDISKLQAAKDYIHFSIKLRPEKAEFHEYLARVYFLLALANQNKNKQFYQYINASYQQSLTASKLRPKWPYSWANMALMKSYLHQFDATFLYSIDKAIMNGPWEIASNQNIAQAIFNGWSELSKQVQLKGISALERVYQQDRTSALDLIVYYQQLNNICIYMKNKKIRQEKACI